MKAAESNLLTFLKNSTQFMIPVYQRTYSWQRTHCQQLWNDILRTGRDDAIRAHFIGSIVYIKEGVYQVSQQPQLLVIDGQQRLTTLSLLIEVLARTLDDGMEPVHGFSAKKLRNYYLLNPDEKGTDYYKLLLTQTDRQTLLSIVDGEPLPEECSYRLKDSFDYFVSEVEQLHKRDSLEALCMGLSKLMLVDISLDRDNDDPQLIFESMNSTGRGLSQADLIRNFVLMRLPNAHQTRLYNDQWRPMEKAFGQANYDKHFDRFMRDYLTFRTGEIPKVGAVYEAFKRYASSPEVANQGVDALVADVRTFARYYCAMALGKETDAVLAAAFRDLRELDATVAYPFLLELYDAYARGDLAADDLVHLVRLIESYVFRRAVCSIPTNSHNNTFATFGRELDRNQYIESVERHFLNMPSYRRFPKDEEFKRELSERDLYHFARRSYLLRRLENYGRKEHVLLGEYSIEHILPQNENLSGAWKEALGSEWQSIQENKLHTLGNLTLTRYNSEYRDHSFPEKRDMVGGFKESPLRLNEGLRTLDTWNELTIQDRSERLAKQAMQVWPRPVQVGVLPRDDGSRTKRPKRDIEDYPHLASGSPVRSLFDHLREEIRLLDPCVGEELHKTYVAYKAETNFVTVLPRVNFLKLFLNLEFHGLQDPRTIARDVTTISHWGPGDAEVDLHRSEDVPYVMGLVRQAFERQMGNDDEAE